MKGHHIVAVNPRGREVVVTGDIRTQLKAAGITGTKYRRARTAP